MSDVLWNDQAMIFWQAVLVIGQEHTDLIDPTADEENGRKGEGNKEKTGGPQMGVLLGQTTEHGRTAKYKTLANGIS